MPLRISSNSKKRIFSRLLPIFRSFRPLFFDEKYLRGKYFDKKYIWLEMALEEYNIAKKYLGSIDTFRGPFPRLFLSKAL